MQREGMSGNVWTFEDDRTESCVLFDARSTYCSRRCHAHEIARIQSIVQGGGAIALLAVEQRIFPIEAYGHLEEESSSGDRRIG